MSLHGRPIFFATSLTKLMVRSGWTCVRALKEEVTCKAGQLVCLFSCTAFTCLCSGNIARLALPAGGQACGLLTSAKPCCNTVAAAVNACTQCAEAYHNIGQAVSSHFCTHCLKLNTAAFMRHLYTSAEACKLQQTFVCSNTDGSGMNIA